VLPLELKPKDTNMAFFSVKLILQWWGKT